LTIKQGGVNLHHDSRAVATGIFKGIKKPWNPLVNDAYIRVDIGGTLVKVPIDRRQIPFLEKEYAIGDMIDVYFEGVWRIKSRSIDENILPDDGHSVF
jgi:hypothetical protein